jgi:hypothetical protein
MEASRQSSDLERSEAELCNRDARRMCPRARAMRRPASVGFLDSARPNMQPHSRGQSQSDTLRLPPSGTPTRRGSRGAPPSCLLTACGT